MKFLFASTFTALALLIALPAGAADQQVIRIGTDPTFAPYESVDHGKLVGIDIELGNAICKQLKAKCEWQRINFAGAIPALKAKKVDAIMSGMTITEKRAEQVLFSEPLYTSPSRLMAPKSVSLDTTAASLKGKTIGIVQGTAQAAYAIKFWQGKGVKLVTYPNDDAAKQDLAVGRIDATFQDTVAGNAYLKTPQGKNLHLTGTPVVDPAIFGPVGMGMRQGDTKLKKEVDGALNAMKKDGTYAAIMAPYTKDYGLQPPAK